MYLLTSNYCNSSSLMRVIYLIKFALQAITITVPIILIVQLVIKFLKAMSLGEDEIKKVTSSAIKTVIPAILIFFVPFIVTFAFSLIDSGNFKLAACWDEATMSRVQELRTNEKMSNYEVQIKKIMGELDLVIVRLSDNMTEEDNTRVDTLYKDVDKAIKEKNVDALSINYSKLKKLYNNLNKKYNDIVWDDIKSKLDELVASSGVSSDGLSLVMQYEGITGFCDDSHTMYKAKNIGDGTITAGYGVTNYDQALAISLGYSQYFPMSAGDCVPVNVIDNILAKDYASRTQRVKDELNKYNLTWSQNQIDAVVSLAYNCGDSYIPKLVKAYAEGGNEGIWNNGFNTCIKASNGNPKFDEGLMKRRKSEYALFTTGIYERGF